MNLKILTTLSMLSVLALAGPALAGNHGGKSAQCPPNQKAAGKAACEAPAARWGHHAFSVRPAKFRPEEFPVTVQFRDFYTKALVAEVRYDSASDRPVAKIPEGVPHALFARTTEHDFMVYWGYFVVEPGAQAGVLLPFGQ